MTYFQRDNLCPDAVLGPRQGARLRLRAGVTAETVSLPRLFLVPDLVVLCGTQLLTFSLGSDPYKSKLCTFMVRMGCSETAACVLGGRACRRADTEGTLCATACGVSRSVTGEMTKPAVIVWVPVCVFGSGAAGAWVLPMPLRSHCWELQM